jgi:hypothetical protein
VDRLSELLGRAVQFAYTCWDRIVLSGYIERLQRPENLIYFFQDVVGIDAIEPAVLEQRTSAYRAWVRRITQERGIPVLAAQRGVRKEELVEPYYRRLQGAEGVACVLTSLEQGRTFVSYVPRWRVPSGDANYRFIKACRKQFLHYYWYVLDPVMGPMSVRVASYFPFNVTCYLNGHSFVAQELTRDGVRFRKGYDLSKLRAKGLVERIGKSRRYCLTPIGLKLGVLLVKLRMRLLGPLASLIRQPYTSGAPRPSNSVDTAYREVDTALDHLSAALGLQHAA